MSQHIELFKATCTGSYRSNLTRKFGDGTRVTVFQQYGKYRLRVIQPDHVPNYPRGAFESEDEASDSLLAMLDSSGIDWRGVESS